VVDLAIAANFVRELTEEQFAEPRRASRRGAQANRATQVPSQAPREVGERKSSPWRRTRGRLAQVRG
jgi:hypothetical protein